MEGGTAVKKGGFTYGTEGEAIESVQAKQMALIDAMILWQLHNPGKPWTQCAATLGVSGLWCRMMANTDAYRARYSQRSDEVMKDVGIFTLKEKIAAAAEVAVERLAEKAALSESMGDISDAAEVLLKHHFGGGGVAAPNATISITQQIILEERAKIVAPKEVLTIEQPKGE